MRKYAIFIVFIVLILAMSFSVAQETFCINEITIAWESVMTDSDEYPFPIVHTIS